jgi:hypothetical protein
MTIKEYLESKRTRQLMSMLNEARANGYSLEVIDWKEVKVPHEEIKTVLDTREHIPNKHEAKALRREASKRGR